MKVLSCIVLAAALLTTLISCRKAELPDFVTPKEKLVMATNRCIPKGGIGIINTDLYVVTKSGKNELQFGFRENWIGGSASTPEMVIVFDGKVWTPQSLPHGFDKSKSVVVFFEEKKISFYDYIRESGGYYERHYEN